ncbi:hypothetical protein [Aestuariimicrobium kwangyangense]|uniref:hypothetical protein n=1 Tax=Aestuariimicrobium kwangyangense TaxID=396389 RepID=UPI0003B714A7|nr:hypothetical protein [Aestuariimicrobium kwangyangense]
MNDQRWRSRRLTRTIAIWGPGLAGWGLNLGLVLWFALSQFTAKLLQEPVGFGMTFAAALLTGSTSTRGPIFKSVAHSRVNAAAIILQIMVVSFVLPYSVIYGSNGELNTNIVLLTCGIAGVVGSSWGFRLHPFLRDARSRRDPARPRDTV